MKRVGQAWEDSQLASHTSLHVVILPQFPPSVQTPHTWSWASYPTEAMTSGRPSWTSLLETNPGLLQGPSPAKWYPGSWTSFPVCCLPHPHAPAPGNTSLMRIGAFLGHLLHSLSLAPSPGPRPQKRPSEFLLDEHMDKRMSYPD